MRPYGKKVDYWSHNHLPDLMQNVIFISSSADGTNESWLRQCFLRKAISCKQGNCSFFFIRSSFSGVIIAMSQASVGPLPLSRLLSVSEGITWCFVERQLRGGCENSWASFAGSCSSEMCHHKTFPVACLALRMCLTSGLWYLTGSVVFATFCGSPILNYSPAQQLSKKRVKVY